jgi:hypothetical protein
LGKAKVGAEGRQGPVAPIFGLRLQTTSSLSKGDVDPQRRTSTIGTLGRRWQEYRAVACGAGLIFAVASSCALGFGTVVERLTSTDPTTRASVGGTSELRPLRPAPQLTDSPFDAPQVRSTSFTHVVDHWYNEPAASTTSPVGRGGFRAPDLPSGAALNELQQFGR